MDGENREFVTLDPARFYLPASIGPRGWVCGRPSSTQLVDRLERDGLVRRRGDPTDRRSVTAELTRPACAPSPRPRCEAARSGESGVSIPGPIGSVAGA